MGSTAKVVISVEGRGADTEKIDSVFCRGNALDALGLSLLHGRLLQPKDQMGKRHATVISDALAKRIWPHEDPLGRRIRFGVDIPNNDSPWLTVVGVVADVKARLNSDSPGCCCLRRGRIGSTKCTWWCALRAIRLPWQARSGAR